MKQLRRVRSIILALQLGATFAASGVQAADVSTLLACGDWSTIALPGKQLDDTFNRITDARCRAIQLPRAALVECDVTRPLQVLGLPTTEFGSSRGQDGTQRVRTVFKTSASRVRDLVNARFGVRLQARDAELWSVDLPDPPGRSIQVAAREDGSSLLICQLTPPRDVAGDLALGLDRQRGGIAGRVSFPGGDVPPMRVCAVPRDPLLRARCVRTGAGADDYLITGLTAGDYDVVSFALDRNPNGFIGAYASALEDCAPNQRGCAGGLLVPVSVRGGSVRTDIDPDRFYTDLPSRFEIVRQEQEDREDQDQ